MTSFLLTIRDVYYSFKFNLKKDKIFLEDKYQSIFQKRPNLTDPESFNEKLIWMSLYDRDLTKTILADKLAVRKIIAMTIGEEYLIPLHQNTVNPEEITKDSLPDTPVIIKTNHASGKVYIVKDKEELNFLVMREDLQARLNNNFYYNLREWQYKNIQPEILVEELLLTKQGEIPEDYKIHCFGGEPKFIQVDMSRFNEHRRSIFDIEWNLLDIKYGYTKGGEFDKPISLEEMLTIAKKLSSQFNYCRIDLYSVDGKVYFGEITFTPGGGFTKFTPESTSQDWGQLIKI
jgi:hypothetical protein